MTEDIKPEVIKMTQDSLGKFIKKPPLTEKLLKKPPFRFLHDIVTSVIRDTGFLSGLYTDTEMQSENIKDRDMKIAFLQKLVDCVKTVTGKNLTVRPSKVVAGLEATKTNELLQAIGYALGKKLDSSTAIAQLQEGAPAKSKSKTKDEKKTTIKTKDKTESKVKQSPSSNSNSTPRTNKKPLETKVSKKSSDEKIASKIKESPKTKKDETKKEKTSKNETKKEAKVKELKKDKSPKESKKEKIYNEPELSPKDSTPKLSEPDLETPAEEILTPNINTTSAPESIKSDLPSLPPEKSEVLEFRTNTPKELVATKEISIDELKDKSITPKKRSAKRESTAVQETEPEPEIMRSKEPLKIENLPRPKTSLRPPSVRPSSARPGAPRLKDRNDIILPPDEIVPMGKVNVIVENFSVQEEDNEETVVVESAPELTFQEPVAPPKTDIPVEKGHLVSQILEQLGDSMPDGTEPTKPRVEIDWGESGGKRNREAASKEMEKLRESIQTLTRAANPLGKLMNFLQEDVDSMRSELKTWIDVNENLTVEIKTQERLIEESIQPLKQQLSRLEEEIAKQHEHISITQANILRNEQKIKTLLTRDG